MSIEIIGPSGSGKSFYLRNFKKVNNNKSSLFFFISFGFIRIFTIISYLNFKHTMLNSKYLSFSGKVKLFFKKEKYFFNFNSNIFFRYYKKDNLKYIDEGYISFFINLVEYYGSFEKDLELYLNNIPYKPKQLIVISNRNKKNLMENMNKRKRWPRKDLGDKYFDNFLSNQIKTISNILKYNKKKKVFTIKEIK